MAISTVNKIEPFQALAQRILNKNESQFCIETLDPELILSLIMSLHAGELLLSRSQLIIVKTEEECQKLQSRLIELLSLSGHSEDTVMDLPGTYESPYSELIHSRSKEAARVSWLYHAALSTSKKIFLASAEALIKLTLTPETLIDSCLSFRAGDELPEDFTQKLSYLGYTAAPYVEDMGQFSMRGGIFDIYSPAHAYAVRVELIGDEIESLRAFNAKDQSSSHVIDELTICLATESLLTDDSILKVCKQLNTSNVDTKFLQSQIRNKIRTEELSYLLPYLYEKLSTAYDFFTDEPITWTINSHSIESHITGRLSQLKSEFESSETYLPAPTNIFASEEHLNEKLSGSIQIESIRIEDDTQVTYFNVPSKILKPSNEDAYHIRIQTLSNLVNEYKKLSYKVLIYSKMPKNTQLLQSQLENFQLVEPQEKSYLDILQSQEMTPRNIPIINASLGSSISYHSEKLLLIDLDHYLGKQQTYKKSNKQKIKEAQALSFSELREGDPIIHSSHGVAIYNGLKVMSIGDSEAEFLELTFKGKDKLFLPIYRLHQVHKYTGANKDPVLDKLGGKGWQKTKSKVQRRLREIADELVKLYATRKLAKRKPYEVDSPDIDKFISQFPFRETEDQLKCYTDLKSDLSAEKPMDRLICGDVGFGKTEMAMRAAFTVASQGKQVVMLAPTTILTFQHFESFTKRFQGWPLTVKVLNRFISNAERKEILNDLKTGKVDVLIGTHRVLSQDIEFSDLGLLIVDEEQKFGVKHKEKIRRLKNDIDTLSMSATPIPRTLNMSLIGLRDLSLIQTAPVDRLPTRTLICKHEGSLIRNAIETELSRGGQIFFLHNRVQTIHNLAAEIRDLVPNINMAVAHGQMDEKQLESIVVNFYDKKIDLLLCTTIIESGIDVPNANTMFIDQSHKLGLSQLYQIRGRVGRGKERAYCYLLVPKNVKLDKIAADRLRVLKENTALGSGLQIAQYDLELRGAGTLLGEEQSGSIDAVGYELYMDLLEEAVKEAKGEASGESVDPEINLRVKALIPHSYMPDIRLRLSYYKVLSTIKSVEDIDDIEEQLIDRFGKPPEEVYNLIGIMMVRSISRSLGVRDVSSGLKTLTLAFAEHTPLSVQVVLELSQLPNKKYSLTPDNRLRIRMKDPSWQNAYEELVFLADKCKGLKF